MDPTCNYELGGLAAPPVPLNVQDVSDPKVIEGVLQDLKTIESDVRNETKAVVPRTREYHDRSVETVPVKLSTGTTVHGGTVEDRSVEYFRGIKYGEVPQRFSPPRLFTDYGSTVHAKQFGPACIQSPSFVPGCNHSSSYSEDCLNLNIYRPKGTTAADRLPVYIWVHGGGGKLGCGGDYDGTEYAEREGIIVVSVNYRLGILGWLAHKELSVENQKHGGSSGGLQLVMDVIESIKWVRRFIGDFGGDVEQITVGGESNGGNILCTLLFSPLSPGLGIKAFDLQSMGCNGPWGWTSLQDGLSHTEACYSAIKAVSSSLSYLRWMPTILFQNLCDGYPSLDNYVLRESPRLNDTQITVKGARVLLSTNDRDGLSLAHPWSLLITEDVKRPGDGHVTNLWFLESGERLESPRDALVKLLAHGNLKTKALFVGRFPGFGTQDAEEIVSLYEQVEPCAQTRPEFDVHTRMLWRVQRDTQILCPAQWLAQRLAASGNEASGLLFKVEATFPEGVCSGAPTAHACELSYRWGTNGTLVDNWVSTIGGFIKDSGKLPRLARPAMDYTLLGLTVKTESGFGVDTCDWWKSYQARGSEESESYMKFGR